MSWAYFPKQYNDLESYLYFLEGGGGVVGAKLLDWQTVGYVEWTRHPQRILRQRIADGWLDDAPIWDDVRTFDGRPWRGFVDILTAGFPCQPFSIAGKREAGQDARNMWPDTWRIIGEVRPPLVLLENVAGLTSAEYRRCECGYPDAEQYLGARDSRETQDGDHCPNCGRTVGDTTTQSARYFGSVLRDLDALGYGALWDCIPAVAARAHHRRDRVWIIAWDTHADRRRLERIAQHHLQRWRWFDRPQRHHANGFRDAMAHADQERRHGRGRMQREAGRFESQNGGERIADQGEVADAGKKRRQEQHVAPERGQSGFHSGGVDPIRRIDWIAEPGVGRVAHGVADRVDRLKALGNGQVPQQMALAWALLSERMLRVLEGAA